MKKISILVGVASLIILFVMFSLLKKGIEPKARTLIKWSTVDNSRQAGTVVMRHLFPALQAEKNVVLTGISSVASEFFQGFVVAAQEQKLNLNFHFRRQGDLATLTIEILSIDPKTPVEECGAETETKECFRTLAKRKFLKKERALNQSWIMLQQVADKEYSLYYVGHLK